MLKILISIYFTFNFLLTYSQTINKAKAKEINNVIYFNDLLYTGLVCDYNNKGQLVSKFEVLNGNKNGLSQIYFESNNFDRKKYKDTSLISVYDKELESLPQKVLNIQSDSIKKSIVIKDYINYQLGGVKKCEQLKKKNDKGKLNAREKEKYDKLINLRLELIQLQNQKIAISKDILRIQNDLNIEITKPDFVPNIAISVQMKNGKENGIFNSFFENGNMKIQGQFSDGKMEGEWRYYYNNNSKLKAVGSFNSGNGTDISEKSGIPRNGRNGNWKFYNEDGVLTSEYNYISGQLNGLLKDFYPNGKIKAEENYVNGVLHGVNKQYSLVLTANSDEVYLEKELLWKNGKLNGLQHIFHSNGKIKEEVYYTNGQKNGARKTYFENGILATSCIYSNNKEEGIVKEYFANGNLQSESTYISGIVHGPIKKYHENGKLKLKATIDSTSLALEHLIGDSYLYKEDGTLQAHLVFQKDGTMTDKMAKPVPDSNGMHNCGWCGKRFNGLGFEADDNSWRGGDKTCRTSEKLFVLLPEFEKYYCSAKCAYEECIHD